MARFDLAQIEGYKDEASAINVTLPQGGVYLLMCALTTMDNRFNWCDEGDDLSDGEWDDLDEELSELTLAILTEVSAMAETIGTISAFQVAPSSDWIPCMGGTYLYDDYPLMVGKVASLWHIDENEFLTPDLRGAFIRSQGSQQNPPIGEDGGEALVTLTVDQMPSHTHSRGYKYGAATGTGVPRLTGVAPTGYISTGSKGGGSSHQNLPPYVVLGYYMRVR